MLGASEEIVVDILGGRRLVTKVLLMLSDAIFWHDMGVTLNSDTEVSEW